MAKAKSYKGRERRKHRRFECPIYISYKKNGEKFEQELLKSSKRFGDTAEDEKLSVSRNVSVSGICFVTKERFPPGTKLLVKIWSPMKHEPLTGLGEVMWQQKRPRAPGYLTGVAFASLDDRKELKKLLGVLSKSKVETMMGE